MLHQLTASRSMSIRRRQLVVRALWSSSTLLRCAAKRVRTASGCGEAAAELRACARGAMCGRPDVSRRQTFQILRDEVYSCKEILDLFFFLFFFLNRNKTARGTQHTTSYRTTPYASKSTRARVGPLRH